MPVSTSVCNMEAALEAAVLSNQHGISYFKSIENCLEQLKANSQGQAQVCSVEMMRKLITVVQEQLPCQRFWQVEVMVSVVKFKAAFPEQERSEGLSVFIDNGLFELLVFVFEETKKHISPVSRDPTASHEADHLMETMLETINDVAEYGGKARKLAVESFATRLIKLVVDISRCFHTRMEAERTLNLLLEGCEDDVIELVINNLLTERLLQCLAEYLPIAGDFEMQIAITESLARLVKKSDRKRYCKAWFKSDSISKAFLNIQDQQFDSDCRKFLNLLNASGPDRSVLSFSCLSAYLGDFELKSPHDENLNEFWVDFNSASKSITMYVADEDSATEEEGGLWETVSFRSDKIKEYAITEKHDGCIRLDLSLTEPSSSFLPSCGSDMKTAYIIFEPMTDLTEALAISLGVEKNAPSSEVPPSTRRSSVSKINVLINRPKNTSWGLSNMPQSFHNGYVDQENSAMQAESEAKCSPDNGKKSTQARRKISIPLVPMSSPSRKSLYSSTSSVVSSSSEVQHSKPNQGFAQPRTPTGPHGSTKKAKTPLQITVADKPNTSVSDNNGIHSTTKTVSSRKVSVSVVPVCPSPRYQTTREPMNETNTGKKSIIALPEGRERPRLKATDEKENEGRDQGLEGQKDRTANQQPEKEASGTSRDSSKVQDAGDGGKHKLDRSTHGNQKKMTADGVDKPASSDVLNQSEEITRIPDTQPQTLASQTSEESEKSLGTTQKKGNKNERKAAVNKAVPERSKRSTRNSSKQKSDKGKGELSTLPKPLVQDGKSRRGQKFKLYSDTSMLMADNEDKLSESKIEDKTASKGSRGRGRKSGKAEKQDQEESESAPPEKDAKSSRKGRKSVNQQEAKVKGKKSSKNNKRNDEEQSADECDESLEQQGKGNEKKIKSKKAREKTVANSMDKISGPLMLEEDDLSQDFIIPDKTLKGKPILGGVNDPRAKRLTSDDLPLKHLTSDGLMIEPDPSEREMTLNLPEVNEKDAANALAAENADFVIPSSVPEERYSDVIPDSQPKSRTHRSLRRSGRFPSPMMSDITEESTLSKSTQSRASMDLRQRAHSKSPNVSHESERSMHAPIIKSTSKPQAARADSTSQLMPEKDPYDFVDSSTISSVPLMGKKGRKGGGAGDEVGTRRTRRSSLEQTEEEKDLEHSSVSQELAMAEDSQEDFVSHSHKFGPASKGSAKKEKKKENSGRRRSSGAGEKECKIGGGDGPKDEEDEIEVMREDGKCPTPSRKRMKGKLDSDVEYIQRIEKETSKSAEFVKRMEELDADEFPDVEVARDVAQITEAYHDRDINEFVSSVMQSLPRHKTEKGFLKKEKPIVGKSEKPMKRKESDVVEIQKEDRDYVENEGESEEVIVNTDVYEEDTERAIDRCKTKKGKVKLVLEKCLEFSMQNRFEELEGESGVKSSNDGVLGQDRSIKKSSRCQNKKQEKGIGKREVPSRKKLNKPASSARNKDKESLTEGEMSMDDLLNAHMSSILGSSKKDSHNRLNRGTSDEEQEEMVEGYMAKKRRASGTIVDDSLEYDVDDEVLKRAEESISRRSRMIAALEHSGATQSDGEEVAETSHSKAKQELSMKKEGKSYVTHTPVAATKKSRRPSLKKQEDDIRQVEHITEETEQEGETDKEFEDKISAKKPSKVKKGRESTENQTKRITCEETTEQELAPKEMAEKRKRNKRLSSDEVTAKSSKSPPDQVKHSECPVKKTKAMQESRTHFGPQIMDSDTEEVDSHIPSLTAPDDTATVVSVESFSNMCKDLLKSSRKGIAAGRERRKLRKVDYTEPETESESSLETSLHTPAVLSKNSSKCTPKDVYEYTEESSQCLTASMVDDAVSERSWLTEKPKHKVSTYSKTRTEVLGFGKITKNLETVKKPKRPKPKERNLNAPKKRKSHENEEQEEEFQFYYYQEDVQEKKKTKKQKKTPSEEHVDGGGDASFNKTSLTAPKTKAGCRRSLMERIASTSTNSQSSQDLMDDGEESKRGKEVEEEEEQEEQVPPTPALTLETLGSQVSAWTTPSSVTRTPKQVSFIDEDFEDDDSDGKMDPVQLHYPVSGPSKSMRPTESTLKRKYPHLLEDNDDEDDVEDNDPESIDDEDDDQEDESTGLGLNLSSKYNSFLQPKKLFLEEADVADEQTGSDKSGETGDGISDHSVTSSWGQNLDFPTMQLPEMFGLLTNRIKQRLTTKKNHTQHLTETAIQSTQKQMNKLFMELHKARQKNQEEFQHKLLAELVEMECSLEKLSKIQAQNEQVLKQYKRKSTDHVEQHLRTVQNLHASFLEKSSGLGEDVVEILQSVMHKEMKNMQQKLLKDMQQQQLQKTMQSLFLLR